MKNYKYVYLLKSEYDGQVDAIIYTNKITEVVEVAIQEAIDEYYAEELDCGQTSYILDYLVNKFDGEIDYHTNIQEIYY